MSHSRRFAVLGALAVALVAWGCDTTTSPAPAGLLAPDGRSDLIGGPKLEFVKGKIEREVEQVATAVIDLEGGEINLLGHRLRVPAGAVAEPTLFVMIVLPGHEVIVRLQATDPLLGTDVGGAGFLKPVELSLSYADVEDEVEDPTRLIVVRMHPEGEVEPLPSTVDLEAKLVTADLDHFSRYGLCSN